MTVLLSFSLSWVERIVDNETIEFAVSNEEIAAEIVVEARKLGVICEIKEPS